MNVNTSLNTTISNKIATIEHLMGLFGLGIDVLIEIDNEEVPILDGSAKNLLIKFYQ